MTGISFATRRMVGVERKYLKRPLSTLST